MPVACLAPIGGHFETHIPLDLLNSVREMSFSRSEETHFFANDELGKKMDGKKWDDQNRKMSIIVVRFLFSFRG